MSGTASILGAQASRVKTDLRLPKKLMKQVDQTAKRLGIPKNAFFTIGVCELLIKVSPLLTAKKQRIVHQEVADLLQKVQENLRNLP